MKINTPFDMFLALFIFSLASWGKRSSNRNIFCIDFQQECNTCLAHVRVCGHLIFPIRTTNCQHWYPRDLEAVLMEGFPRKHLCCDQFVKPRDTALPIKWLEKVAVMILVVVMMIMMIIRSWCASQAIFSFDQQQLVHLWCVLPLTSSTQ